jgi:alpha-glucosidase
VAEGYKIKKKVTRENRLMISLVIAAVVAQTFDCDYSNFRIQPISEFASTFPSQNPIDTSFYAKFINYKGFPIASSSRTSDQAVLETAKWVCLMLNLSGPQYTQNIINFKGKMTVMARYPLEKTTNVPEHSWLTPAEFWDERARGLGASIEVPTASCAEENVLCDANDRYRGECIAIHEFAHAQSLLSGNQTYLNRLDSIYQSAMSRGLWANTYSTTSSQEYWAEGVQAWFDCNTFRETPDGVHGPVSTRDRLKAYDPELSALIRDFYGDTPLRYSCPANVQPPSTSTSNAGTPTSSSGSTPTRSSVIGVIPGTVGSVPRPTTRPIDVPRPTSISSTIRSAGLLPVVTALFLSISFN